MVFTSIVHYGVKSKDYLLAFEHKRVDYIFEELAEWNAADLRQLLSILQNDNRTFAESQVGNL